MAVCKVRVAGLRVQWTESQKNQICPTLDAALVLAGRQAARVSGPVRAHVQFERIDAFSLGTLMMRGRRKPLTVRPPPTRSSPPAQRCEEEKLAAVFAAGAHLQAARVGVRSSGDAPPPPPHTEWRGAAVCGHLEGRRTIFVSFIL